MSYLWKRLLGVARVMHPQSDVQWWLVHFVSRPKGGVTFHIGLETRTLFDSMEPLVASLLLGDNKPNTGSQCE